MKEVANVNSPIIETLTASRDKANSLNPFKPKEYLNPFNRKFSSSRKLTFCSLGCLLLYTRVCKKPHRQAGVLVDHLHVEYDRSGTPGSHNLAALPTCLD